MEKIDFNRLIIYATKVCNLRCKMCGEYIPLLKEPPLYEATIIKKALYEYFRIVRHVNMITISGGEPFLAEETHDIAEFLSQFSDRYEKLEVMTNGTLLPSENLVRALSANPKSLVFINHYGELSDKVTAIEEICAVRGVRSQTCIYHGEDCHCDGWYDLELTSGIRLDDETKIKERFAHCQTGNNKRLGLSHGLFGNKLYACSVTGIADRLGLTPDCDSSIDLCDDAIPLIKKRSRIMELTQKDCFSACAVCVGNDDRVIKKRYVPAEQME